MRTMRSLRLYFGLFLSWSRGEFILNCRRFLSLRYERESVNLSANPEAGLSIESSRSTLLHHKQYQKRGLARRLRWPCPGSRLLIRDILSELGIRIIAERFPKNHLSGRKRPHRNQLRWPDIGLVDIVCLHALGSIRSKREPCTYQASRRFVEFCRNPSLDCNSQQCFTAIDCTSRKSSFLASMETISLPITSEAVAAGDGTLQTCRIRSL